MRFWPKRAPRQVESRVILSENRGVGPSGGSASRHGRPFLAFLGKRGVCPKRPPRRIYAKTLPRPKQNKSFSSEVMNRAPWRSTSRASRIRRCLLSGPKTWGPVEPGRGAKHKKQNARKAADRHGTILIMPQSSTYLCF